MAVTTLVHGGATTDDPDDLIHRIMATPEGHADPYALYHQLREAAPVHRSGLDGVWYVSGFDAARQILGDAAFASPCRRGIRSRHVAPKFPLAPQRKLL